MRRKHRPAVLTQHPPLDPYFRRVALLLNMMGADNSVVFRDLSPLASAVTPAGDVKISTSGAQAFGGGVAVFDGTGDYLSVPANAAFGFGTAGDYTIEAFVNPAAIGAEMILVDTRQLADTPPRSCSYYVSIAGKLAMFDSNTLYGDVGSVLSAGSWYHVAFARAGTTTQGFLGGVSQWSTTAAMDLRTSRPVLIGANYSFGASFNGRMAGLRITNGVARYTANFTPPRGPFPES